MDGNLAMANHIVYAQPHDFEPPICEECDLEMHRFGADTRDGYVEGWACQGCGWSFDDENDYEPQVPNTSQEQIDLFEEWKKLGCMVSDLSCIVQNDVKLYPLTNDDKINWQVHVNDVIIRLNKLSSRTYLFLYKESEK